jgi:hypothetical protein
MRITTLVVVATCLAWSGLTVLAVAAEPLAGQPTARWTAEQACRWYERQPWLVGCNFLPSTAVNDVEMWQQETFDPATIDRELGWAQGCWLPD